MRISVTVMLKGLTKKLLNHQCIVENMYSSLSLFYDRYHDMINLYLISGSQLLFVVLTMSFSLTNYHMVCNYSNTTGVASRTGPIHSSSPPTYVHPRFLKGSCYPSFSFLCSAMSIIDSLCALFPFNH